MFALTDQPINVHALREQLTQNERCGAFNSFEGWVRRHNDGKTVDYLVYSAYAQLAQSQGEAIIAQAKQRFAIEDAVCVHRVGKLAIGEIAVFVGVSAGHRDAAFAACRFIIDPVKAEVPIWKQEFYTDGSAEQPPAWLANAEALPK